MTDLPTPTKAVRAQKPTTKKAESAEGPTIVETPGYSNVKQEHASAVASGSIPHVWNQVEKTWVPIQSQPNFNQAPTPYSQPQAKEEVVEDFFVVNMTPGYHVINGDKHNPAIELASGKVEDLSNLSAEIKRSLLLRSSLVEGKLRRISRADAEKIIDRNINYLREENRNKNAKAEQGNRKRKVRVDGMPIEAEIEDLNMGRNSGDKYVAHSEGNVNDPATFADVVNRFADIAASRGQDFDVAKYRRNVTNFGNGNFLPISAGLVKEEPDFRNGSVSGAAQSRKATVAVAPSGSGGDPSNWGNSGIAYVQPTNFNRDRYISGQEDMNISTPVHEIKDYYDPNGFDNDAYDEDFGAEAIDLNEDMSERGGFKRLG